MATSGDFLMAIDTGATQQGDPPADRCRGQLRHPAQPAPPRRDAAGRAGRRMGGRPELLQRRLDGPHRQPAIDRGGAGRATHRQLNRCRRGDDQCPLLHHELGLDCRIGVSQMPTPESVRCSFRKRNRVCCPIWAAPILPDEVIRTQSVARSDDEIKGPPEHCPPRTARPRDESSRCLARATAAAERDRLVRRRHILHARSSMSR